MQAVLGLEGLSPELDSNHNCAKKGGREAPFFIA